MIRQQYISPEKVRDLIPPWAYPAGAIHSALEDIFQRHYRGSPVDPEMRFDYWIEVKGPYAEMMMANNDVDHSGKLIIDDVRNPLGSLSQIVVPLFEILSDALPLLGGHCMYFHTIMTEMPLTYVGVTKQTWYSRFGQHVSSAKCGSPLVFHSALRKHASLKLAHHIILSNVDYDTAMENEERFSEFTLYPKGMNMIPGGFAGLRYLARLGFHASSFKQRDAAVEKLAKLPSVAGKPNPLCAARWQSDQDYINRVICGHGERLTVEQVRQIRLLADFGKSPSDILASTVAKNARQVNDVLKGKYYGRIS